MEHNYNDNEICTTCGCSKGIIAKYKLICKIPEKYKSIIRKEKYKLNVDYDGIELLVQVILEQNCFGDVNKMAKALQEFSINQSDNDHIAIYEWISLEYIKNKEYFDKIHYELRNGAIFESACKWKPGTEFIIESNDEQTEYKVIKIKEGKSKNLVEFRKNFQVKLFPSASETFFDNVEMHARYFFPYAQIPLNLVVPGLGGSVPWIVPFEPLDGVVGDEGNQHHTHYSRNNWIGFDLIDGKLRFDTDFLFFKSNKILSKLDVASEFNAEESEMLKLYNEKYDKYNKGIEIYNSKNEVALMIGENFNYPPKEIKAFTQIGYEPPLGGNWDENVLSLKGKRRRPDGYPCDHNGNKMIFLGSANPYFALDFNIIAFINQDYNKVAFTFDWS